MANTFKTFLNNDIASARTLLHEAIPITGTIVSGTYEVSKTTAAPNIKTFAHGMFESVYDYPYLSSSANHIFDLTAGYSAKSGLSASSNTQNAKKINVYNQMAQVLVGYDVTGAIDLFDKDGDVTAGGTKMKECFFVNFARLLTKDEIKKDSFRLELYTTASGVNLGTRRAGRKTLGDYGAATSYKVNSPTGEYGLLYTASADPKGEIVGHVYYQAGIAVLTASIFSGAFGDPNGPASGTYSPEHSPLARQVNNQLTGSTITELSNGFRFTMDNVEYNNTTELNSTIYFCRANTQDYNYSSNPTYLTASKIRVKNDNPKAEPVSYITTVGLYSADNELLAVAKLSEPLKKSPSNELTLRVRLDY
ncbi:MAG: hypothetical protein GOVbin630_75 [Prokaryotic dsDNA virus sp.]|nr:MAG: hypothetical protein GOVbin630_75 [Prokaryotic dsDNA virus sp.]|tara:strand:- start:2574 stop:3665 length:1092 start_codon:yes stop_codon:yes gene_type:complete